jgi:hypothetical protein
MFFGLWDRDRYVTVTFSLHVDKIIIGHEELAEDNRRYFSPLFK